MPRQAGGSDSLVRWAIAAIVVPIAAAGIGYVATKSDQSPSTSTTSRSPTTTTQAAYPTAKERDLLSHVPRQYRAQCKRQDDPPENTIAAVICVPPTVANFVRYQQFTTREQMNDWYSGILNAENIGRSSGDCAKVQVGESQYFVSNIEVGRLACYRQGGRSWVVWTRLKLGIGASAYRNDLNDATLYKWWTGAGPLDPGDPD